MGCFIRFMVLGCCFLVACAGSTQSGQEGTTPRDEGQDADGRRFVALETGAHELSVEFIAQLPEVAEEDVFLIAEAVISAPPRDAEIGGWSLEPPEDWTVGSTADGEEVRLEFLEPEGGAMVVSGPEEVNLEGELTVTWLVRYSRRNTLLTEAGTSIAVHVVPVAAMLVAEGHSARYWISSEASL